MRKRSVNHWPLILPLFGKAASFPTVLSRACQGTPTLPSLNDTGQNEDHV